MREQEPWGPDFKKPTLDYDSSSSDRSPTSVALNALTGVGGYLALMLVSVYLIRSTGIVRGWAVVPLATLPPLLVMLMVARLSKSQAMMLASGITFCVALLSCGICSALLS